MNVEPTNADLAEHLRVIRFTDEHGDEVQDPWCPLAADRIESLESRIAELEGENGQLADSHRVGREVLGEFDRPFIDDGIKAIRAALARESKQNAALRTALEKACRILAAFRLESNHWPLKGDDFERRNALVTRARDFECGAALDTITALAATRAGANAAWICPEHGIEDLHSASDGVSCGACGRSAGEEEPKCGACGDDGYVLDDAGERQNCQACPEQREPCEGCWKCRPQGGPCSGSGNRCWGDAVLKGLCVRHLPAGALSQARCDGSGYLPRTTEDKER